MIILSQGGWETNEQPPPTSSLDFQILASVLVPSVEKQCSLRHHRLRDTWGHHSGLCFLSGLVSTPVPGVGKGPGARPGKLNMRQSLQFPWETENIFLALWMRKLKQREEHLRFSEVEGEPRAVRLGLVAEPCSLALAGHPSSFWEPNSSGARRNTSC